MNLQLDDLDLFLRVAALGSLSAVARERNLAVSQVSRALSRLEASCGRQLVQRSTHGLRLTDEGHALRELAPRMVDLRDELQASLGEGGGVAGWVRVSASGALLQGLIAPSLPELQARHPALHLDLFTDDRLADLVRDNLDLAIRTGPPVGEHLLVRRLGWLSRSLYATPAYLAQAGTPDTLDALREHRLIVSNSVPQMNRWALAEGHGEGHFEADGPLRVDSSAGALALVLAGLGVARVLDRVAAPWVARGALRRVPVAALCGVPLAVHAVMRAERLRLPKVRACLDHWAALLAGG